VAKQAVLENEYQIRVKKPAWLRRPLPSSPHYAQVRRLISQGHLHTVCQEAQCPNQFECFSARTATFLILGANCTRTCRFCAIDNAPCEPPDPEEPARVAAAARQMNLRYVVVTSVTRDDLPDGGAGLFAETIRQIHRQIPDAQVEVLIPDFQGDRSALEDVLQAGPDVLNHNVETVARLYATVRPEAVYARSLELLRHASTHPSSIPVKSGLMLGLGETPAEIRRTLQDIRDTGCQMLTLGQYLQPSKRHLTVERFVTPDAFDDWRRQALEMGFSEVVSGPFVRSSYHARELHQALTTK
jgi:lipoic acid synthetase